MISIKDISIKDISKDVKNSVSAKKRAKDTEYLYASAYLRTIEDKGVCRELLSRMLEAEDAAAASAMLFETYRKNAVSENALCDEMVNDAYKTVDEAVNVEGMFTFMRYPYDANNVKAAIKCAAKGISADGFMFACGTLPEDEYVAMASSGDYSALPGRLADAARTAAETYAKTGDPQSIDLPVDKACLEAMLEGAKGTGSKFIRDAITLKVDASNVLTALRVAKLNGQTAAGTLERALANGGTVPVSALVAAVADGESVVDVAVKARPELASVLDSEKSLGELERALDNAYLSAVYAARKVLFGCEIPFAYLVSAEYNSKNARIILAGKRAGLSAEAIGERMRLFYV